MQQCLGMHRLGMQQGLGMQQCLGIYQCLGMRCLGMQQDLGMQQRLGTQYLWMRQCLGVVQRLWWCQSVVKHWCRSCHCCLCCHCSSAFAEVVHPKACLLRQPLLPLVRQLELHPTLLLLLLRLLLLLLLLLLLSVELCLCLHAPCIVRDLLTMAAGCGPRQGVNVG